MVGFQFNSLTPDSHNYLCFDNGNPSSKKPNQFNKFQQDGCILHESLPITYQCRTRLFIMKKSVAKYIKFCFGIRFYSKICQIYSFPFYIGRTLKKDTFFCAKLYYYFAIILNPKEYITRRTLAKNYSPKIRIPSNIGYTIINYEHLKSFQRCLAYSQKVVENLDPSWESQKSHLRDYRININNPVNLPIVDFALDPEILAVLSDYIGTLPVLGKASILYSPNEIMEGQNSQQFHFDGADVKHVKLWIPLKDIDSDSGPLTMIPARESIELWKKLKAEKIVTIRNQKVSDEIFYSYYQGPTIEMISKTGNAIFTDTCRCFHYGSRPGNKKRYLLLLHYYSVFSIEMPTIGKKYSPLFETNDRTKNLVLGLQHQAYPLIGKNYDYYI